MDKQRSLIMFSIFVLLWVLYFFNPYSILEEETKLFFTVATFLFSIYTGFFISRQGVRYSQIRKQISVFDGEMTTLYRVSESFGKNIKDKIAKVLKKHYNHILKNKIWDYHLVNKTDTYKTVHKIYRDELKDERIHSSIQAQSLRITFNSLRNLQSARKQLIMLHNERISLFQWLLTTLLALMLLTALTVIPSHLSILNSFIKAIASTFVVFMCVLLYELDRLKLFESTLGENSAQDVVDIIKGKK